jgi:hypothetical protein
MTHIASERSPEHEPDDGDATPFREDAAVAAPPTLHLITAPAAPRPPRRQEQRAERRAGRRGAGRGPDRLPAPLSPAFVIAAANAFVGLDLTVGAKRAFGSPPSLAERFLLEVGAMDVTPLKVSRPRLKAWDAAFVQHVAYWALYGGVPARSSWPLRAVRTADELAELARRRGMLDRSPAPGDLYLLWSDATRRFMRTGIVVAVIPTPRGMRTEHRCEVIEGSTSPERPHDGRLVLRFERRFGQLDRFVRWTRVRAANDFNPAEEVACA